MMRVADLRIPVSQQRAVVVQHHRHQRDADAVVEALHHRKFFAQRAQLHDVFVFQRRRADHERGMMRAAQLDRVRQNRV